MQTRVVRNPDLSSWLLALGRRLIGGESLRLFGGLIQEDYPLAALFVPLSGQ